MKKLVLTITTLFYLLSSTGATVNFHYCMDRLVDWSLGHEESDSCNSCGMAKPASGNNGCCKDEEKFFKNTDDQKTVVPVALLDIQGSPAEFSGELFNTELPATVSERFPISHAPPLVPSVPVHVLNCVFRI